MVIRSESQIEFDIYRKPTFTGRLITSDSYHNYKHKIAAFHSMAHRMVSIPLRPDRYEAERERIVEIGKVNGYQRQTIMNIVAKHEDKKRKLETSVLFESSIVKENVQRAVIPFVERANGALSRMYRDEGLQMVNKNIYSIQKMIGGFKDKVPALLKAGVYEISCEDGCDYAYYGMIEPNPNVRCDEHAYCIKKNDFKSAVARHMIENRHVTSMIR